MLKVIAIRNGNRRNITDHINLVNWEGDSNSAYRKASVIPERDKLLKLSEGDELQLYYDNAELFRGYVFGTDVNKKGTVSYFAYDNNVYLTKNKDTRKFKNVTASQVIKRLCNDYGIEFGDIAETNYVIPKLILRNKTLYEIIKKALSETEKQTGRRFFIMSNKGKLSLLESREQIVNQLIKQEQGLFDVEYSQSISDLKTKVKVISNDGTVESKSDDSLSNKFGSMEYVEKVNGGKSQAKQRAEQIMQQLGTVEDEVSISTRGITGATSGKAVYVKGTPNGLYGGYYVLSDKHVFTRKEHKMSLTITAGLDLPQLVYKEGGN